MTEKPFQTVNALLLAAAVLVAAAWLRGAEYDEQYTLFLTAGVARPAWPAVAFPAATVAALQAGHASMAGIAHDLRATDVHPPLYFWAIAGWRWLVGPGLFAARMFSVVCGMAALVLVGAIAGRRAAARAILLTAGCYAFVYTCAVARGFAAAEVLILAGTAALLVGERRQALAGLCLGAASACNYLAAFSAVGVVVSARAWRAVPAMLPFVALDAWFFAAQHGSRDGQFPPFSLGGSLARLAAYQTAAVFGGLPLYCGGWGRIAAAAAVGLAACSTAVAAARAVCPHKRVLLAGAAAPAIGLLGLGIVFDNTPIELRYFCFGLPFLAILLAGVPRPLLLGLQAAGIAGLLLAPRTMQPARAAARAADVLPPRSVVLVPAGNDGVGIVGAFGIEARPDLRLLVIHPGDRMPDRFVLAALAQDRESQATISALRTRQWRRAAIGSNLFQYERIGAGE